MRYLIVFLFFFISCKNDKKDNTVLETNSVETLTKNVRKNVEISNLNYHSAFDGAINEGEYEEYFGSYLSDRFNEPKQALFLDGISDYGKIYNHDKLNSTEQISISIWYKPDSYKGNGNNIVLSKSNSQDGTNLTQYAISTIGNLYPKMAGTIKLSFSIDGVLNTIKTEENAFTADKWHLLTGVYDGSKMSLYVNGKLLAGRKVVGKLDVYNFDLLLGKTPDKELYTSGAFDDLKIFNKALSRNEIELLYDNK